MWLPPLKSFPQMMNDSCAVLNDERCMYDEINDKRKKNAFIASRQFSQTGFPSIKSIFIPLHSCLYSSQDEPSFRYRVGYVKSLWKYQSTGASDFQNININSCNASVDWILKANKKKKHLKKTGILTALSAHCLWGPHTVTYTHIQTGKSRHVGKMWHVSFSLKRSH